MVTHSQATQLRDLLNLPGVNVDDMTIVEGVGVFFISIAVKLTEHCTSVALEPANSRSDVVESASICDVPPTVVRF